MRTFAVLLVLANLAFLAWQQGWLGEQPAATPALVRAPYRTAPQTLRLIEELPGNQVALMSEIAEREDTRSDTGARLAELEAARDAVRGQLNEGAADTPAAGAAVVAPAPWCGEAGPFADEQAAAGFVDALSSLGARGAIETRDLPVSSTWWVYLPAFATEAEALATFRELQDRGVDSYYMRSGELAGGISLGVFSRRESAATAQEQLEARGYQPSLYEMFRTETRPWVSIFLPDPALREAPEWAALEAPGLAEKACETIAP